MEGIQKVFEYLKKGGYKIFGPKEQDGELHILELDEAPPAELLNKVSDRPYKYFFTPAREILLNFKKSKISAPKNEKPKIAFFGMSIFDCKALELYDEVFKDDFYYQERRKNILAIGYSSQPLKNYKTIFFEIDLGSAVFDIFIESAKLYARGKAGEKILKRCGLKYKSIEYKQNKEDPASLVFRVKLRDNTLKLRGVDKKILAIKKAVENSAESKLWDELGKICLACGKCTIACPTCYCFDLESKIGPDCRTERCAGNCFYDDFTRIAGGHKFLNNPKEKIFFWYYHKFVRIPFGYGLPGCTDCGRCTAVCPVGINIKKNIERLLREVKSKNEK